MTIRQEPAEAGAFSRMIRVAAVAAGCALAVGCGTQYYTERLEETRKLYSYYQRLDNQLHKTEQVAGVEIRVPKPFSPIPGPPPQEATAEGEAAPPPPDPRQTEWFQNDAVLPGLEAAWVAQLPMPGDETRPAYIYLLSNYNLWRSGDTIELAQKFEAAVQQQLIAGLNLPVDQLQWATIKVPQTKPSFTDERSFLTATWPPPAIAGGTPFAPVMIDGTEYAVTVYMFQSGDNRAALVYARPQNAETGVLKEQIELMLETVELTGSKPASGGPGGGTSAF